MAHVSNTRGNARRLPIIAPAGVLVLLAGIAWQRTGYEGPEHFEPYHRAVADAAPAHLPEFVGTWKGTRQEPTPAAVELLRSNVLLEMRYEDLAADRIYDSQRVVSVVLVQCKNSRDMQGHYPPNCYPNVLGWTITASEPRDWDVAGRVLPGTAYAFRKQADGRGEDLKVFNFLVVPGDRGGSLVRDMNGLNDAAEDYRRRFYGAAQVQVVFFGQLARDGAAGEAERDAIFAELLEPMLPLVDLMRAGLGHPLAEQAGDDAGNDDGAGDEFESVSDKRARGGVRAGIG